MSRIREMLRQKSFQLGCTAAIAASSILPAAFALDGDAAAGNSAVVSSIQTAVTSVKGDAATVIGAAVGLGVVFWGAKVLWSKFKSMAK
jgi:hypothetical protein